MWATITQAAGFDCKQAQTKTEQMICDPSWPFSFIKSRDDELDITYQWALMRVQDKQKLLKEQRYWLKNVRNACSDRQCLAQAYFKRLEELAAQVPTKKCYTLRPIVDSGKVLPIEPVCQVLEKNLNQFCDQPPMACGLKIAPEFRNRLSLPTWTPLDPEANRALIEEFIRAPWQDAPDGSDERRWQEERDEIEKAFSEKHIGFSEAQLDLYNLGKKGTAYRLDYGDCKINNAHFKDRQKWNKLIHPASVQIQHAPNVIRSLFQQYVLLQHSPFNEVLLFDGKIYDFAMGGKSNDNEGGPPADNWFVVNRRDQKTYPNDKIKKITLLMNNICRFNYQPTQGE
ncbi:hypothetical protein [Methylobacter sp.]|uniref:lysozyme inhibitor LprI family protein n=1 Tax=Methylobacter sp. TaxID=2051955 RepID=UPI00248747A1|nr:hypothetical protein [Methylobacter sp.]MDI1278939.1 hypothetical protein [Methylobacter sp.]MDI1360126.1 hypothetical protein [Methylobacter sp.]